MSISSIHAHKFYEEVVKKQVVFTLRDKNGYVVPQNLEGKRSMPFWSLRKRVEKIIGTVPAYKNFKIKKFTVKEFKQWCASLRKDKQLVGLNWSGKKATGYDIEPDVVLKAIDLRTKNKIT